MSVVDALQENESSALSRGEAVVPRVGPANFELLRVIGKGGYGKVSGCGDCMMDFFCVCVLLGTCWNA